MSGWIYNCKANGEVTGTDVPVPETPGEKKTKLLIYTPNALFCRGPALRLVGRPWGPIRRYGKVRQNIALTPPSFSFADLAPYSIRDTQAWYNSWAAFLMKCLIILFLLIQKSDGEFMGLREEGLGVITLFFTLLLVLCRRLFYCTAASFRVLIPGRAFLI